MIRYMPEIVEYKVEEIVQDKPVKVVQSVDKPGLILPNSLHIDPKIL